MIPFETVTIDATVAACDGDGGALGHPKVYLNLAPAGRVECPYCSRRFVNPIMAAGLIRIGELAQRITAGDGDRGVAHATSGPCLQQNLVCVLEGE